MDPSKLTRLPQIRIDKPCPEDWDKMEGNEKTRFCASCGCNVNNIGEMSVDEAEQLLNSPSRVCARATFDAKKGILTRDGWIPRLLVASAMAASVAGCSDTTQGGLMPTKPPTSKPKNVKNDGPVKTTQSKARSLAQGEVQLTGFFVSDRISDEATKKLLDMKNKEKK